MFGKLTFLLVCLALANGNPAAGEAWHWKPPMPVVNPITGSVSPPDTRIVGGSEAVPHSSPWQVALFSDGGSPFCGGSLISKDWVLTTAYCMLDATFVEIVMGAHNLSAAEDTQVVMNSNEWYVHEKWEIYSHDYAIGVIKLPSPAKFDKYISSVALPSVDVSVGDIVTSTGWGWTYNYANIHSDVLREVNNTVISLEDCAAVYYNDVTNEKIVCTDTTSGEGLCVDDYGGPMSKNGIIYGISAFTSYDGCGIGHPDGYVRVFEFLDWIETMTGITP